MSRRKLKHFEEMKSWPHVLEPTFSKGGARETAVAMRGHWGPDVRVELACGGGDYSLALAEAFPASTVVGVDIKGARMWWGAKAALERGLSNLWFLRSRIEQLEDFFAEDEVDEFWITFPNPHPARGKERKRLTSARFLKLYAALLKPKGLLHLKTDDSTFFHYSLDSLSSAGFQLEAVISSVGDLPAEDFLNRFQTLYERRYRAMGRPIHYCRARFLA